MALFSQLIGAGRPDVIFLHGLFGRGKNWAGIARALTTAGHTSLLVDLPNHGRSQWTDTFDYAAMADDLATALRDRLGDAASVNVVGHSMGGKVAMLLALIEPELVQRLVVVDIAPDVSEMVNTQAPLVEAMRALDLAALGNKRAEADAALAPGVPDQAVRQFLLQNLKLDADSGWRWELNLGLLGDHLEAVAGWPDVGAATYPGPTLWVAGERSSYIRPEHEAAMRALFPAVRLVSIPDAGHWVHADAPTALTRELSDFLAS